MKRWFSRDKVVAKIGLAIIVFFMVGGIALSMHHAIHQNTDVPLQNVATKNASANAVDLSEKPKIPVTETKVETTQEDVPYTTTETYDGTLPKDTEVVRIEGVNGKKTVKTEVKYKDGIEVSRELISEDITVPPVAKVVAIGTKVVAKTQNNSGTSCDTHYSPCVKIVSDETDCKDIGHQVKVVTPGDDPLNLDRNNDGVGCDNYPKVTN